MKSNHWFIFIFLPALCMVDKLQSFHKGIRSTLFCAGWDNGATPIVWDSLPSWTMFRGAITPSPMATAQQPKNGVNSTSAMATPVFVKERQRGRDVWEKKHVCVCVCVFAAQQGCNELCWPGCPCSKQPQSRPHCWHSATWCVIYVYLSTHGSIHPANPAQLPTFHRSSLIHQ